MKVVLKLIKLKLKMKFKLVVIIILILIFMVINHKFYLIIIKCIITMTNFEKIEKT